jgi:hypothetical protein
VETVGMSLVTVDVVSTPTLTLTPTLCRQLLSMLEKLFPS